MKKILLGIIGTVLFCAPKVATAQDRVRLEILPGASFMVRGGGTYNHIEIENAGGDIVTDSGHGFGWEAGTGLAFPLGDRWHLTPGVRFRSLKRDLSLGNFQTAGTLRYVAAEVGVSRSF